MPEFSTQDVAFTGFGVVRQHPRALLAWWIFALAFSLLLGAVFVGLVGRDFGKLMAVSSEPMTDPAQIMALMGRLAPAYVAFLVLALGANAILSAAMIRAVLRPQEDRFGYLRLGEDELRQLGLVLLTFLLFMGLYFGVAILIGIVLGLLVALTHTAPNALLVVLFLGAAGLMLFLGIRLSLAPALTFDTRRINLVGSWGLTRGWFWRLFGTYLLTFSLVAVVYLLSLLLIFAVGAILTGGDLGAAWGVSRMGSLKDYFAPARLAQTVLNAGVSALVWPLIFTPPAAIYRAVAPSATGGAFA